MEVFLLINIFKFIGIIGMCIISKLAFIIPKNPYEIVPSVSIGGFDKPLWLVFIVFLGFVYLIILTTIYDKLEERDGR